ncbi:unnamed protein product, partial [marine sediment metagenome]
AIVAGQGNFMGEQTALEYAYEDSPTEKVYFVLEGEITVKTKKEEVTLGPWDSVYLAPNEGRELINKTNKPVSMLVIISS